MYFEFPDQEQRDQEDAWREASIPPFQEEDMELSMPELERRERELLSQPRPNRPYQRQTLVLGTEMTELQAHLILQHNTWHLKIDTEQTCSLITLGPSSSTQETPNVKWQILTRKRFACLLVHSQWSWLIIIDRETRTVSYSTMNSRFIDSPDFLLDSFLIRSQLMHHGPREQE
ncbi:NSs protein [Tai orthobunyavirus]|nr:NSs protein [Tai orthobunyavirus]